MDKTPLAQNIRLFNQAPQFRIDDSLVDFEGRPDVSLYGAPINYEGLFAAYGLKPTDFREQVANLKNPEALEARVNGDTRLELDWVTSVDVKAKNEGKLPQADFFQIAAIGITVTQDDQIVLGIRGGKITPERREQYASGLYGLAPGGSVTFSPTYHFDPIRDTLVHEFKEELGNYEVSPQRLIGTFEANRPGPVGIKFVGVLKTDATLGQLQRQNMAANTLYDQLTQKGAKREEAKAVLKSKGLPVDAWEHKPLLGIFNDPAAITHLLETQQHNLAGISAGALELYALYITDYRENNS